MAKRKRLLSTPMPALETKSASPLPSPAGHAPVAQVAGDAASTAAVQEMADYIAAARIEGRLLVRIPLRQVDASYLERDRIAPGDPEADEEMQALVSSLQDRGQQVPIDVVRHPGEPGNVYGLITGLRRLTALRHLLRTTGEQRFGEVIARVIQPENLPDAYRAMIEENEIRAGLSFYERARIVLKSVNAGVYPDTRAALRALYANVSRAKRSKIGSFIPLIEALDDVLRFPEALSEKRGLAVARALKEDPKLKARMRKALTATPAEVAAAEQDILTKAMRPSRASAPPVAKPSAPPVEAAGIVLSRQGRNLILSGPGVDSALEADLVTWLRMRTPR